MCGAIWPVVLVTTVVIAHTPRSEDNAKDWRSLIITVLVGAGAIGLLIWLATGDWLSGLLVSGTIIGLAVGCVVISVVFGIICIPPMMLVTKFLRRSPD